MDVAVSLGDLVANRRYCEGALALHRRLGNARGIAGALWGLGYIAIEEGDPAGGLKLLEESVGLFRELGDENFILHVVRTLAWAHHKLGDFDRARELHEANLEKARARNDRLVMANTLGSLAAIAVDEGRIGDAMSLIRENDGILRDLRDLMGISENLVRMARALAVAGRAAISAQVIACFQELDREAGGAEAWVLRESEEPW